MSRRLLPCPDCDRHVLAAEEDCPFCGAVLPVMRRRSLGAMVGAMGLGVAVAGCPQRSAPKYGGPPPPTGEPAPGPSPEPEPETPDPAPEPNPDDKEPDAPMYGMPAPPPKDGAKKDG